MSRFILLPNRICPTHTTKNFLTTSRYYSTSKQSLLLTHITICQFRFPLLLYLQTQSALFVQHTISLQCLSIIVPSITGCSIHTKQHVITESRFKIPAITIYFIHTKQTVISESIFILTPNTFCPIHTTQNVITVSRYYCTSKQILLHSHNTKCHYRLPLLLYQQTLSAPFNKTKYHYRVPLYCTSKHNLLHSHITKYHYRFPHYCTSNHSLLHSHNTTCNYIFSL